jgi:hypothetical protein
MNSGAFFSLLLLAAALPACLSVHASLHNSANAVSEAYYLASSLEEVSFERFCLEKAFDSLIQEGLEGTDTEAEAREKIIGAVADFVSVQQGREGTEIAFSSSGSSFEKEGFSDTFILADPDIVPPSLAKELLEAIIGIPVYFLCTGDVMAMGPCLKAVIKKGKAKEVFMLPAGYSALGGWPYDQP